MNSHSGTGMRNRWGARSRGQGMHFSHCICHLPTSCATIGQLGMDMLPACSLVDDQNSDVWFQVTLSLRVNDRVMGYTRVTVG